MPFALNVAADVYGKKYNKLFTFPICPSMNELVNAVESRYDVCARANRPAGYEDVPFRATALQQYDVGRAVWVDVANAAHLVDMSQLFVFQPESLWHTEARGMIPNPSRGLTWLYTERPERKPSDTGPPATQTEKLRSVFQHLDRGNKGHCQYTDIREGIMACGIDFTDASSADVFKAADTNGDGHVTYDEWVKFSLEQPEVVDAIYFSVKDAAPAQVTGWLTGVQDAYRKPVSLDRDEYLKSLREEAAVARERVKLLKDYELAQRDANSARMLAVCADAKAARSYQTYLHADVIDLPPMARPRLSA